MEHEGSYKNIPGSRFSKPRKVKTRVQIIEELIDGTFRDKITGRIMTAETFEIFKKAAAMDGIVVIIKPFAK